MNHRQTQYERSAEGSFPYWVCLIEEKCTGPNYEKVQEFCRVNGLTLSRNGHSVVWQKEWYQVFRFADEQHAETFMKEFGGERMHPSERGKGKRWSQRVDGWSEAIPINCILWRRRPNPSVLRSGIGRDDLIDASVCAVAVRDSTWRLGGDEVDINGLQMEINC